MCVMNDKEFFSDNSISVSDRYIKEREILKKNYQADLEEVFLDQYEEYRNDMLEGINDHRTKLVRMLLKPITFENYTIDGYDEVFRSLRDDLEALGTLDAFFDVYLKGAIAHKTHINP